MKRLFLFGFLAFSNLALSQGIPTYDNASVMIQQQNFIKQLAEMAEQLKVAEAQLNSFKEEALQMQKRFEGYSDLGNMFDVADLNKSIDSILKNIDTSKIDDFLSKNNVSFDSEGINNYKRLAESYSKYDVLLENLREKESKLDNLRKSFSLAQTPQEREELSNNISLEKIALDNERMAVQYALEQEKIMKEIEEKKEHDEWVNQTIKGGLWDNIE